MKLLTYRARVQSVGAFQQVSVASGALWDLAGRASMYQRKWNPLPSPPPRPPSLEPPPRPPSVDPHPRPPCAEGRRRAQSRVRSCTRGQSMVPPGPASRPPRPLCSLRLLSRRHVPLIGVNRGAAPPSGPHYLQLKRVNQ